MNMWKTIFDAHQGEHTKWNEVTDRDLTGRQDLTRAAKDQAPQDKQKTGTIEKDLSDNVLRIFDEVKRLHTATN